MPDGVFARYGLSPRDVAELRKHLAGPPLSALFSQLDPVFGSELSVLAVTLLAASRRRAVQGA